MGVSPAVDTLDRYVQEPLPHADLIEDKKLLATLIGGLVGDRAAQMSDRLIARFGTLPQVLKHFEQDEKVSGGWPEEVANLLANLSRTFGRVLRSEALPGPILSTAASLLRYLRHEMADLPRETFRVLLLNSANRLLADQVMWEGTVSQVQIHPREVVREALRYNATALIMVHNHPSGNPRPSEYDIAMTARLVRACEPFDVAVHDHLIVAREGCFSMQANGLMGTSPAPLANATGAGR